MRYRNINNYIMNDFNFVMLFDRKNATFVLQFLFHQKTMT